MIARLQAYYPVNNREKTDDRHRIDMKEKGISSSYE
jgi:hypothetical protein